MADGITQRIRLELDKQALKTLEKDAASSGKRAAEAIAAEISGSSAEGRAVQKFIGGLREQFEQNLLKIRRHLAQGLVDLPEAARQAQALAATFNAELEKGLKKAAKGVDKGTQTRILEAAKIDADSVAVAIHRSFSRELAAGIKEGVDKGIAGLKAKTSGLFNLVNVPDQEPLSQKQDRALLSKVKGDRAAYNILLQRTIGLNQLEATTLTPLGKLFNWLGVNVNNASTQVKGMVTNLTNLGVAKGKINAALPVTTKNFMNLAQGAMALAKQLGLVYSAYQALNFIKSSVQDFIALEQAWAKLAVTTADYGVNLRDIKPQVDALLASTAKLGYTQAESLEILTRLSQITGDSQKAMRALPTVLNLAASGYMTLEQATRQVGRAMLGDITQIQRYGIFLEKNVDVITQLEGMFGGEAAAKAATFGGNLKVIGAQFNLFKVALGEATAEGLKSGGAFDKLSDLIQHMTQFINENHYAVGVWASFFKMAFLGVAAILSTAIVLFVKLTNVILLSVTIIEGTFRSIPNVAKIAFSSMAEAAALAFRQIAQVIDAVLHTQLTKAVDDVIIKMDKMREAAKKDLATTALETRTVAAEVTGGGSQEIDVPNPALGTQKKPRSRYLQNVSAEISASRKVALGEDPAKSEKVMERLSVLRDELVKQSEALVENDRAALDYNARIADIDKIRTDLAAKRAKIEKDAAAEAALTRRINLLGNVALGKDDKNRIMALEELSKLHSELIIKRDKLNILTDKYWQTENHIKEIEDKIAAVAAKDDEAWDKKLKRLGQQVDFDVDSLNAQQELLRLYNEQKRIYELTYKNDDERIKARLRMLQIEQAMRSETDNAAERAKALADQLGSSATRVDAERKLVELRNQLNEKLAKGLVVSTNIEKVQAIILGITTALNDEGQGNLRLLDRQLSNAEQLLKHSKTRKEALAELVRLENEITAALEKGNLTEAERQKLIAQRERVKKDKKKAGEPDLNVIDDLMKVVKDDIPDAFAAAANESAKVFTTAFEYILRDSRNLKTALSSIPKGLAAAMMKELSQLAEGKVREQLAWALEQTAYGLGNLARGNFAGAGANFASAGEHTAAAAAWGLVAGATASLGKSADTAYGNATSPFMGNATGNRGQGNDGLGKIGPDIYLTFDPLDPNNARHQDLIGATSMKYQERYGGRIIIRTAGAA